MLFTTYAIFNDNESITSTKTNEIIEEKVEFDEDNNN